MTLTAEAADCDLVSVERALYILGSRTAGELGTKWELKGTWSDYCHAALRQVDRGEKPLLDRRQRDTSTALVAPCVPLRSIVRASEERTRSPDRLARGGGLIARYQYSRPF